MIGEKEEALKLRSGIVPVKKRWSMRLTWITLSFLTASGTRAEDTSDTDFHDIHLSCPSEKGGKLELVRANKLGQRDRITIIYDGASAIKVEVAAAEGHGNFETYFSVENPETETDPDIKEFAETVLAKTGMMRRGVCLAPESERQRYFLMIDRQKKYIDTP